MSTKLPKTHNQSAPPPPAIRANTERLERVSGQAKETKHRLIQAGLTEIAEHGYAGARVERITSLAGYGYGTFYKYFKAKKDLVREIMKEVYDDIFADSMAETHSSRPVAERAFIDILASLRAFYRHRETLRILEPAIGLDPELSGYRDAFQWRDVSAYEEIIRCTPGYRPVGDPHIVSLSVNALVDEVARRWIHSPEVTGDLDIDDARIHEIARTLTTMAVSVVAG